VGGATVARMNELERDLRARFAVRLERFSHGDFAVELVLPRAADELIDVSAFNVDERLPYWAELWPSARALARSLLEMAPPAGRVLELGCGLALPSLALAARGASVVASDWYPEALEFARANALRNSIPPPETRLVDWRAPPPDLGRFALVLAADVLYEKRNADALAALLPLVTAPGGRVLLADPGRVHAGDFRSGMERNGWKVESAGTREEAGAGGVVGRVRLDLLRPPA
jgi:predicted nicotinamide N-methyase